MDRHSFGEEGLTTLNQQSLKNELKRFSDPYHYLNIGLAYGLDGHPRDFAEIYKIVNGLIKLKKVLNGETPAEHKIDA